MRDSLSKFYSYRHVRTLLAAIAIIGCLFAARSAATFGLSRLLATYSLTTQNLAVAKKAVALTPRDADAHFAEAVLLGMSNTPEQTLTELQQAVALRPADYTLWQQLGLLHDQVGNQAAALAAFDESIKRAPFYSQPRWNRGNILLRSGQYDIAFADLNRAAQSNPDLVPILIDLAWGVSRGDVQLTEQLTHMRGDKMRLAFAKLLARRGKAPEAVAQLGAVRNVPETVRHELIDQLLAAGAFTEAFEIWKDTSGLQSQSGAAGPVIYDGGFEGSLAFGERGFGWRVPRDLQSNSFSLDSAEPNSGTKNLRIEFSGNSNPGLSQLIIVEPAKHYRINFAGRSQDVVTGGLPILVVSDAGPGSKRLGQSPPLPRGSSNWQLFTFEFTTAPTTTAVLLSLQRESCTTSPCPIFGAISLDSFSIEQLK